MEDDEDKADLEFQKVVSKQKSPSMMGAASRSILNAFFSKGKENHKPGDSSQQEKEEVNENNSQPQVKTPLNDGSAAKLNLKMAPQDKRDESQPNQATNDLQMGEKFEGLTTDDKQGEVLLGCDNQQ